jgi:hypothetical protein
VRGDSHARFGRAGRGDNRPGGRHCVPARLLLLGGGLLQASGAHVHLVHPLGLHRDTRRVKNDIKDSTELANRLRRAGLPESCIAPPEQKELRELVR